MKIKALLLFFVMFNLFANSVYSQTTKISLNEKGASIEKVLDKIEQESEFYFLYNQKIVDVSRGIDIIADNKPINEILDEIFKGYDVRYVVYDHQIILFKNFNQERIEELYQQKVTGKITDATTGEPLADVNVVVIGTTNGYISDANGNYSIETVNLNDSLEFSFIGYQKLIIPIDGRRGLDIKMKLDIKQLEEIVVVGYGVQKKVTLTGPISTIDYRPFVDRGSVENPLASLQGQVSGMLVTRNSTMPGREDWSFQIRGASSINGADPLILVDGLPFVSNDLLNSLNPSDIESISILKDAAASAIYGARAAGGVVLITTKRASSKPIIQYNGTMSLKMVGLMPTLCNLQQYSEMGIETYENDMNITHQIYKLATMMKERINNNQINTYYDCLLNGNPIPQFGDVQDYTFFNKTWPEILWGNAISREHQLSISSRSESMGYRLSIGYLKDGSLLQWGNNSATRYNVRLANDYNFSKKLKIETNISIERNEIIQPTFLYGKETSILGNYQQPGFPVSTINGKPYAWGTQYSPNMLAEYGGDSKEINTRINTNMKLTYKIFKDLNFIGSAGIYYGPSLQTSQENAIKWYNYTETYNSSTYPSRNSYEKISGTTSYYNLNGYFDYAKSIADYHDVSVMFGSQIEMNNINSFSAKTLDILVPEVPSLSLSYGDASTKSIGEIQSHWALAGYFSRIRYSFKNKYLFEVNSRYDGTSRFTRDSRWKLFYGFLAGWRISQESFMQNQKIVDNMKVRVSWGSVGNQAGINLYDYVQLLAMNYSTGPTSSTFPIIGTNPVIRVSPTSTLVSLNRSWERVQTTNFGLDLGFLKDKLTGSFDYYFKHNNNMLLNVIYPATLGALAPKTNNGKLKTWGWEATIEWRDNIGLLTYHISGNISDNQNKLIKFGGQSVITAGYNSSVEGYPIGSFFGLKYSGRIQTQEQLDEYKKLGGIIPLGSTPSSGVQIGDNMFEDKNGDGKLTTPDDFIFLGTDVPRYSFATNMGLEFKGFDFSVIFQGIGGRTIIRTNNWRMPWAAWWQAQNAAFYGKTWRTDRIDAPFPRLSAASAVNRNNYQPSDWVAENGNYIRLKKLTIGYTVPVRFTQKIYAERVRFYLSANDLFEITHINDGWDPEATRGVSTYDRAPFYRLLTFGFDVTF
jgi:TonB-linked SusC/RagA family outer membrane protein